MKPVYLLYGIVLGLLPLVLGLVAEPVDPHGWPSVLPWFVFYTLPVGAIGGLILMVWG